jgi:hypothetical protein
MENQAKVRRKMKHVTAIAEAMPEAARTTSRKEGSKGSIKC